MNCNKKTERYMQGMDDKEYLHAVERCQEGEIDELEFLLMQEELSGEFLSDMEKEGKAPCAGNARAWLLEYEKRVLYEKQ